MVESVFNHGVMIGRLTGKEAYYCKEVDLVNEKLLQSMGRCPNIPLLYLREFLTIPFTRRRNGDNFSIFPASCRALRGDAQISK